MLLLSCERTETSWQTGNQNERRFGESFQDMLCSREEFGKRGYSDCWDWRIGQVRCLDNPNRWRIYISCGRWFSKIIMKRLRIPRTQSETGMKSFDLTNKKMTQKIGNNFSLFKDASFIVIILNREFNLRAERRVILYFTRLTSLNETFPRRNTRRVEEDWRKAKTSEAKTNLIIVILQGKDWILYFITIFRKKSFRWKDLKKALHVIFFEGESKHTLSCLAAQRICETKFFK